MKIGRSDTELTVSISAEKISIVSKSREQKSSKIPGFGCSIAHVFCAWKDLCSDSGSADWEGVVWCVEIVG